jgi:hypothetical protein
MVAQNLNLSWGGANLLVSGLALDLDDSVVVRFPWGQNRSILAHADVAWSQQVNNDQGMVGISFSRLRVRDEEKLQHLLSLLAGTQAQDERDIPIANELDIRFLDRQEMLAAIEQVRSGILETTLFQQVEDNARVRLLISGSGDLPRLNLRARVLWHREFGSNERPQSSDLYQVALAPEHPEEDLRRVTDPLIEHLTAANYPTSRNSF